MKCTDDDSEIVEACINGDLSAWSSLTQKYESLIRASIVNRLKKYGITLPCQDIEDIRQNTLTSIWKGRKLEEIRNRKNISYWLAIVSGNTAIEYMRWKRAQDTPKPVPLNYDSADELEGLAPSNGRDPSDEAAREEMLKKIKETIEALPHKEKLMIKLNIYHGKKYHEIADILNIPAGTVSSYIKRAREKLKKKIATILLIYTSLYMRGLYDKTGG